MISRLLALNEKINLSFEFNFYMTFKIKINNHSTLHTIKFYF